MFFQWESNYGMVKGEFAGASGALAISISFSTAGTCEYQFVIAIF
jgi:hypothetical protein